jgi:hypothetical protein
MTAERVARSDGWVGCVLSVETGVFVVLTDRGELRASLDGSMLCHAARDRSCLPVPGDWVTLRAWCDGRVTVAGPMRQRLARVVPLRRP